jgi:FeS assembly SUF system protein
MENKPHRVPLPTVEETPAVETQPAGPAPAAASSLAPDELKEKIIAALETCYDPEIPVNIYELGLVYGIDIDPACAVTIHLTLTSPSCPAAGSLPGEVQRKAAAVQGVTVAKVELVWDPPWDPSRMTEAARLQLGLDYY